MANKRTYDGVYTALKRISDEEGVDFGLDNMSVDDFKKKYFTGPGNIENLYNKLTQISDEEGIDFGQGTRDEWLSSFGYRLNNDKNSPDRYLNFVDYENKNSQQVLNDVNSVLSENQRVLNRMDNQQQRAGLSSGVGVQLGSEGYHLGENTKVTKGKHRFDLGTGKMKQTYITPQGNEYDSREMADLEQDIIDIAEHSQTLQGQIEDADLERKRLKAQIDELVAKQSAAMMENNGFVYVDKNLFTDEDNEQLQALRAAYNTNEERATALAAERDDAGFWQGFIDAAKNPSTYTFGLTDLMTMSSLNKIKNKIDTAKENGVEPELTAAEQSLLENTVNKSIVDQQYGDNRGFLYRAGGISMQALPFVGEFILTGGFSAISQAGANAGTRLAEKMALEGFKKSLVRNTGVLAGDIAAGWAMANTTGAMRTGSDIMQRHMGEVTINPEGQYDFGHYDENGQFIRGGKSLGRSIYEAEVANTLEYYTEKLGEHLQLGKWMAKGAEKMGLGRLSKAINYLSSSKWLEKGGIQDYPSEVIEEEANLILNAALVGDNKFSDLVDGKTQSDIWGGMMLSIGLMQSPRLAFDGYNSAGYYAFKKKADIASNNASEIFGADNWQMVKEQIDQCDNEHMAELLSSIVNGDMKPTEKIATMNYAGKLLQMRGYNMRLMADAKDQEKQSSPEEAVSQNLDQSYQQGHMAESADEKKAFYDESLAAGNALPQYGKEFAKMVQESNDPVTTMNYLMSRRDLYTDEQIAAAADYYQKLSRATGMLDASDDAIDMEVEHANAVVRSHTHQETGQVLEAKGTDNIDYYIIGGEVTADEQGQPVIVGTGGAVVVQDRYGNVSVKSPQELTMYNWQLADDLIQQNETTLRQQLEQQADDDISFGSPANEVYNLEDQVVLMDGQGGSIQGTVGMLPNSADGVFVIYTEDGKALQLTADDLNRRIVNHNGAEVQRLQPADQPQPAADATGTVAGQGAQQAQQTQGAEAGEEAGQEKTSGNESPASALSRIPVRTNEKGQPMTDKKGRPILDWHKASVEDAAAALVETTDGDMLLARDNASYLINQAKDKLEKIRKQKPKGEDPIELGESRLAIRRQEQEQQAIIKQWQDVNLAIQKQIRDEEQRKIAEREAAKSEAQRQREAEEARIRQEQQDEADRKKLREAIEKENAERSKEYEPLVKARKELANDADAMDILNDTEPSSFEEWVSHLLNPHSFLWLDASDSERGLKTELGLNRADMQRFMHLFGNKENGAKPFSQVALDIYENLPEGMQNMYSDKDVERVLRDMFQGMENSGQMMHLTELNRIEKAREQAKENERRDAEAEMDAWAEAYHLTPEERETFEDYMQQAPSEPEQEIINNIIADEQFRESLRSSEAMDQQPVSGAAVSGTEGGESQVQQTVEAASVGHPEEGSSDEAEAGTGEPSVADNDVLGGKQGGTVDYEDVIADLSEPGQSDAATDVSKPQTPDKNGKESINAETQASSSMSKGTKNSANFQENLGKTSSAEEISQEEAKVDTHPTDAQKEAGNYQKGHVTIDGFDVTIENPKGSVRSGVDGKGNPWSVTMNNTYGYIRGTEGVDGDHIDVFLSDNPASGKVWVIDQVKPDGSFDEHKVMYGFVNATDATNAYLSNYSEGWQGLGAITGISRQEFKKWVESSHRKTKPFAEYKSMKKPIRKPFETALKQLAERDITIDDADLLNEYGLKNVTLSKTGDHVSLTHFVVAEQGKGNGTRFMTDLAKLADTQGWTLTLTPDTSFGGTSVKRLKDFYKRFDFKDNKGRYTDFMTRDSMVRKPQAQTAKTAMSYERDKALMDAYIEHMADGKMKANISTDIEEAQRILDEYYGSQEIKAMGSRVDSKKKHLSSELDDKELSKEQQIVADVYTGKKDNVGITFNNDGIEHTIIMRQGNEEKAGTKHSLYRHYGTGVGVITSDDVLRIPDVLSNGVREEKKRRNVRLAQYQLKDENGKRYTVITEIKDSGEIFNDFYTNKKASSQTPQMPNGDTPEGARTKDLNASSDAKVQQNSETANDSDKKIKQFKTPDGYVYGFTYQGRIYVDPRIATSETPIHEYGHLWVQMKRQSAPEEWENIKSVFLNDKLVQPIIDKVKQEYPELAKEGREDDFVEELVTQFSGKHGAERMREMARQIAEERGGIFGKAEAVTAMQRMKTLLSQFWASIAKMMGWKYRNANEIADKMMLDFLEGMNPSEEIKGMNHKRQQMDIISRTNPMHDDIHTGIRTVDDIKTFEEAYNEGKKTSEEGGWEELASYPDITNELIEDARKTGKITVYSSYPINDGAFVTPSMMQAKDYAGEGRVYSKRVPLDDVAWINLDEGQYAKVKKVKPQKENVVARDKEYAEAVAAGDTEKVDAMLREEARRKGYSEDTSYQGSLAFNGAAPSKNGYFETREERKQAMEDGTFEDTFSLGDYADAGIDANDLEWQLANPMNASAGDKATLASIRNINNALKGKSGKIKMYRAVDAAIKENSFRNGDWVTPSREYAAQHIGLQDWKKGRIIEEEVPIDDIWWNGDDINEWGYDDGKGYAYKNTKNNRKLMEPTYDNDGNLIPLSQRFNDRKPDIKFQMMDKKGATEADKLENNAKRMESLKRAEEAEKEAKYAAQQKEAEVDGKGFDLHKAEDSEDDDDVLARRDEQFEDGQTFPIRTSYTYGSDVTSRTRTFSVDLLPDAYSSEGQLLDAVRRQYPSYYAHIENGELVMDSWDSVMGDARLARTMKQQKSHKDFIDRKTRNAVNAVKEMAQRMGLDVEVLTTMEGLTGKKARYKGWFNPKTGKIVLVLPNHSNQYDLINTLLHEGVAHFGLRKMFGVHFATFLDNVYENVSPEIKARIDVAMKRNSWSRHEATEEYLARLAERTDFENAQKQGWWQKIKDFFFRMLGMKGFNTELTDNELRYILWRSYDNLLHPDRRRNIFDKAREVMMQSRLRVGNQSASLRPEEQRVATAADTVSADSVNEELLNRDLEDVPSQELLLSLSQKDDYERNEAINEFIRRVRAGDARIVRMGREMEHLQGSDSQIAGSIIGGWQLGLTSLADETLGGMADGESKLEGRSEAKGQNPSSDSQLAIISWAKATGHYYSEDEVKANSLDKDVWQSGFESRVYRTADGKKLIKFAETFTYFQNPLLKRMDGIALHNAAGFEPLTVLGFSVDDEGRLLTVVEQPYVDGVTIDDLFDDDDKAKKDDYINRYLENVLGLVRHYDEDGNIFHMKDGIIYKDLHGGNILYDKNGQFHVIDGYVSLADDDKKERTGTFSIEDNEKELYSIRTKEPPKKTGVGYKVFVLKDGQLYPPMVANPNGEGTPVGVWLDADAAPIAGESKTGRPQVKAGGKGTQGGSGQLAYRPGWHLGTIPYALQFNRKDANGERTLFPNNFVWAEVEYADDVDYQDEARQEGMNANGKYQHSLAGVKHVPTDGSYKYRTNPDPRTDEWVITGAMRVNRILTRAEVDELVREAGREPQQIQDGDIVSDDIVKQLNDEIKVTKEADDMGLLARDDSAWMDDVAKDFYEKAVAQTGVKFKEAWQDSMVSLKLLQNAIARETGRVATGAEDAYRYENRMHGKAKNMTEQYDYRFYRPMLKAFSDFCKERGYSQTQGLEYLIAKSGLERNLYYAMRGAVKDKLMEEIKEQREQLEKDYAANRLPEADYKDRKASLEDKERHGVDDAIQELRDKFIWKKAKEEYDNGNISYSEYLRRLEAIIRHEAPKYDDYAHDYSGLTETFAKDMYDDAQEIKKQAQRAIDPRTKGALWKEYNQAMKDAYEVAHEYADDAVFSAEPSGDTLAKELWQKINAANEETLKNSYESSMMERKTYDKVRSMFDFYIPLRGWEEDKAADVYTYMGKDNVFSPAVKKTWGRTSQAENPLAYIGNIAVSTILVGQRNLMKQHFLNYVMNNPTSLVSISESWYENIGTAEDPMWIVRSADTAGKSGDEIAQIVNDFNEEMKQKQHAGLAMPITGRLRLDVHATSGQKAEHVIEVQRAGHTYQLYINGDPKAAQALNGTAAKAVSRISDTVVGKFIADMNRSMAAFFTSKNPAFVISNLSRDLNMAGASVAVNEDLAYHGRFVANVYKVLRPRLGESSKWVPAGKQPTGMMPSLLRKWKKGTLNMANETERLFKEFMDEGGETGFVNMLSVDSFKEKMNKEIAEMNGSSLFGSKGVKETSIHKGIRLLGDTFEFYNRCAEDATRFIVYMTSRQMGKTLEESIADAKDVTLNFNRKGTGALGNAEVRDLFIFVNPAIQALANMYRMYKNHPLKLGGVALGFMAAGVLIPIINQWLLNMFGDDDDKDTYWNLAPWVRKNNLVFWVPGTKYFITIPLAQEFRVFYGVGEMIGSSVMKHPHNNTGVEIFESVADLVPINPMGNGGSLIINFMPTTTQPILQIALNTNFEGKPIWKDNQGNKYDPMFQKAYASTPKVMTYISEGLNTLTGGDEDSRGWLEKSKTGAYLNNPAVWNHLLQGYFGGMYNTIAKAIDVTTTAASGEIPNTYQIPIVNRFVNSPWERDNNGALGEEYWSIINENEEFLHNLRKKAKKAKSGDTDAQEKLDKLKNSEDYRRSLVIGMYKNIIDGLRKQQKETEEEEKLSEIKSSISSYKNDLIDELTALEKGEDPLVKAKRKFDDSEDPEKRKALALRISKEAGAAEDPYGDKPKNKYQSLYQELRTADDVYDDALLLAYQQQLRDEEKDDEAKLISNQRKEIHSGVTFLFGGKGDKYIMDGIRKSRKAMIKRLELDKNQQKKTEPNTE